MGCADTGPHGEARGGCSVSNPRLLVQHENDEPLRDSLFGCPWCSLSQALATASLWCAAVISDPVLCEHQPLSIGTGIPTATTMLPVPSAFCLCFPACCLVSLPSPCVCADKPWEPILCCGQYCISKTPEDLSSERLILLMMNISTSRHHQCWQWFPFQSVFHRFISGITCVVCETPL